MKVFVTNPEKDLFLNSVNEWGPRMDAYNFKTTALAVDWCVRRRLCGVRIILESGDPAQDMFLDVHGNEQAALQAAMSKNRELSERLRVLAAQLEAILAQQKERKKQFPFKRKQVSEDESESGSAS